MYELYIEVSSVLLHNLRLILYHQLHEPPCITISWSLMKSAVYYFVFSVSFTPEVYVPNQLIGVRLGDDVRIECRYSQLLLEAYIAWRHDFLANWLTGIMLLKRCHGSHLKFVPKFFFYFFPILQMLFFAWNIFVIYNHIILYDVCMYDSSSKSTWMCSTVLLFY